MKEIEKEKLKMDAERWKRVIIETLDLQGDFVQ